MLQGSFFLSRVSLMFGQVISLFVADEAFVVSHMFCPFTGREIDLVSVHGIGVLDGLGGSSMLSQRDVTVSSSLEFPELYHLLVELSCLIQPLFLFPASLVLSFWESSSSHHDSKLLGHSSLKGIHQDAIEIDSTMCLSQSKGSGI